MTIMRVFLPVGLTFLLATQSMAWDGVDSSTGAAVEIESGNLVRSGETIEIYDQDAGEYRDVDVESVDFH